MEILLSVLLFVYLGVGVVLTLVIFLSIGPGDVVYWRLALVPVIWLPVLIYTAAELLAKRRVARKNAEFVDDWQKRIDAQKYPNPEKTIDKENP